MERAAAAGDLICPWVLAPPKIWTAQSSRILKAAPPCRPAPRWVTPPTRTSAQLKKEPAEAQQRNRGPRWAQKLQVAPLTQTSCPLICCFSHWTPASTPVRNLPPRPAANLRTQSKRDKRRSASRPRGSLTVPSTPAVPQSSPSSCEVCAMNHFSVGL